TRRCVVSDRAQELLTAIMALPAEDRAELRDAMDGVGPHEPYTDMVARRRNEMHSGEVPGLNRSAVLDALREKLK
ncbi:MAG: hypothetical protein ACRCZF_17775, partial [Gemmataceae bacterium]